jgi:hypothetical protein
MKSIIGTGFPACAPRRQDAGATKIFSDQTQGDSSWFLLIVER